MKFFIIIRGPLGSGKTTIAKMLSKRMNAKYVSIDKILDEYGLTQEKEVGYISQKSFIKANQRLVKRVKQPIFSLESFE